MSFASYVFGFKLLHKNWN